MAVFFCPSCLGPTFFWRTSRSCSELRFRALLVLGLVSLVHRC